MIITGLALTGIAALIHVYIFYIESIAWTTPRAYKTFGTTEADARATKGMAFNQGFYNLFLAISVGLGILFVAAGNPAIGATLVFVGAGSMVLASVVLVLSDRTKIGAALKQGVLPLLGLIVLMVGLAQ